MSINPSFPRPSAIPKARPSPLADNFTFEIIFELNRSAPKFFAPARERPLNDVLNRHFHRFQPVADLKNIIDPLVLVLGGRPREEFKPPFEIAQKQQPSAGRGDAMDRVGVVRTLTSRRISGSKDSTASNAANGASPTRTGSAADEARAKSAPGDTTCLTLEPRTIAKAMFGLAE